MESGLVGIAKEIGLGLVSPCILAKSAARQFLDARNVITITCVCNVRKGLISHMIRLLVYLISQIAETMIQMTL